MSRALTEPAPGTSQLAERDLERLLLIRHFETALLRLFAEGKLNGTTHTCLGQEYIPVALNALLRVDDFVLSNHRGHGHYLARFADPEGLLAEIMGREGAVCSGVGGSQHIYREGYLSTGVQGQNVPVGVGVALRLRQLGSGQLAAVFIGDGTWGEGAVYEALNLAQLWQVPLLLIVENNHIAQSTPLDAHMAGDIAGRARAFGVRYHRVAGIDINRIRVELAEVVAGVRRTPAPAVVEFDTVRIGAHSKGDDTRDAETVAAARARDWYTHYERAFPARFALADAAARRFVAELVVRVERRPPVGRRP
ncbi:MAG TPA: thiamine pyrophosphate-dependent dehydrogenase E1 component subunit alpha [Pseudonocardiaceae bacterium]|jgi:pyruvate dehydrogenase E1 component alpha subunit|nr:thiamine pyrophosphate-dependent dehydrogenase E1 component subunit alpha [Pseudonocardiaceae bacterium]